MSPPCLDLVAFADGELDPERAAAFRTHLASCAACRAGLVEAVQLATRLAAPEPASGTRRPPEGVPDPDSASIAPPALPPRRPPPRWNRLAPWIGAAALAAAAVVVIPPSPPAPDAPLAFADQVTRPYDVRFAYPDVLAHRPARGELRGTSGPGAPAISYAALAALERRGDQHGLLVARAWNGERPTEVAAQLKALAPSPARRSDQVALEIVTTSNDDVEAILAELEALQASGDPAAIRAAGWNYAIVLDRLGLAHSAAQAFHAIAATREPGWADEAQQRGDAAARRAQDARSQWEAAWDQGKAMVATGAPVALEVVRKFPGLIRAELYNAVRAAPSRARVLALAPIAAELDRVADRPILGPYVLRIAGLDFARRAPLAAAYAGLLRGEPLPAAVAIALTRPSAPPEASDIALGVMVPAEVTADQLGAYQRMARQLADPWHDLRLAQAEAAVELGAGNWLGGEARLEQAARRCGGADVSYQCLAIAQDLGKLYADLHRVPEALKVLGDAVGVARATGEWGKYRKLLWALADLERFNASTATARAYAGEVLQLARDRCDSNTSAAHRTLTGAALLDVDGRAARRHLEAALRCGAPDLRTANYLGDIARLDPQPGDVARLAAWLTPLRASPRITASERVLADAIEGRLVIEHDRAAGTTLLEAAIASAATLAGEVTAAKARAGAASALVFDAARHADPARALRLIAQELAVPAPTACAVAMLAEDERAVVIVRGADGRDHASFDRARSRRAPAPTISDALAVRLDGCGHVQVLAHAALQGQPRVLPARFAWSYATGAGRAAAVRSEPADRSQLVVSNVTPPAALHLAPLQPRVPDAAPTTRTLSGASATPLQVIAAMTTATEIQFHTHALVNMGMSDASYLVLSPEPGGRYALTAEAIRGRELAGRPLVVLAACHSAQGARYQHAPWSLPHAFLAAGARGVLAAATEIPDLEAGPLFDRVLARVRAGAAPAAALRDERIAALARDPASWVADVILFE
jgi:cellulose synthase operon protein C